MGKWSKYSADMLNKQFKGKLTNKGGVFVKYGEEYDVNPAFAAAISCWESARGTSKMAKDYNNVFGMLSSSGPISYSSIDECIQKAIYNLRMNYLNEGLLNAQAIQKKYAPVGASNDPTGLNSEWLTGVEKLYREITGEDLNGADLGGGASSYAANSTLDGSSTSSGSSNIKTTSSFKTNPATDWLLDPTEDEKKYGINIYEGEQPLIKFSTYSAISEHGDCVGALKKYSEFLYYLLNSEVTTSQVTCVGMPWIRPGFNVWLDPLYSDAIYYCRGVQHQGDPTNGATTSLSLVLGRNRQAFINDSDRFGSFKNNSDNVFISDMKDEYRVDKFGSCLASDTDFENVKKASENYYATESFETTDAKDSEFHKQMYVYNSDESPKPQCIDEDKIFSKAYTESEINEQLKSLYEKSPEVVQERRSKLKSAVKQAEEYFNKYHILEKHTFG